MVSAGISPTNIKKDMRILGYHFTCLKDRKVNAAENQRLDDATARLLRIRSLPGSTKRRQRLARMTVCPKASWGWICKRPTQSHCDAMQRAAKTLFLWPKHGSVDLIFLIAGHYWDLQYMALSSAMRVLQRFLSKHAGQLGNWPRKLSGWTKALRIGMRENGWTELDAPWSWNHSGLGYNVSLNTESNHFSEDGPRLQHRLREAWRYSRFHAWKNSGRLDACDCPDAIYNPERIKLLHKLDLGKYELGILTGATVSPARWYQMQLNKRQISVEDVPGCPWCHCAADEATYDHVTWTCPSIIPPCGLNQHCDALERRLGWPDVDSTFSTISWIAMVREKTVHQRYDDG